MLHSLFGFICKRWQKQNIQDAVQAQMDELFDEEFDWISLDIDEELEY